jgi:hypothetical protein
VDRLANAAVFAASTLGVQPHPGQVAYLMDDHPVKVLVGGRRAGKTTALAAEVCFYAAGAVRDRRPFRQLLVAPALDQAKLLLGAVAKMLRGSPLGGLIEGESITPFPELRLAAGGVVFVRAAHDGGRLLRGHAAERVIVDEAAYVADDVVTESLSPMLADTGGQLVLASTPALRGALFHRMFERGQGDDARVRSFTIASAANPHLDAAYVASQRAELTSAQFATEWLGQFVDTSGGVFAWDHVHACATGSTGPAEPRRRYSLGYDCARRHDRSAVVVLDVTERPFRAVHVADIASRDYEAQVRHVAELADAYNGAAVTCDETGAGIVVVEMLRRAGAWVHGFTFTAASKAELITSLAVLFERREIVIPEHRDLLDELRYYERTVTPTGHVRLGAPEGGRVHDDFVTALALAARGAGSEARPLSLAEVGLPPFLTGGGALGWQGFP